MKEHETIINKNIKNKYFPKTFFTTGGPLTGWITTGLRLLQSWNRYDFENNEYFIIDIKLLMILLLI